MRLPPPHVLVISVLVLAAGSGCKKKPIAVLPDDEVQCCFLVPYEGLNGQTIDDKQCRVATVCVQPGEENTEDVCKPFACKPGDVNPYGVPGPGGATTTVGSCSVDNTNITVIPQGCADGGGGAATDQAAPAPGEGSGADSSGT